MGNVLKAALLPLSDRQLADALIDEVRLGIVDDVCRFVEKFENKKVFNNIYRDEIQKMYQNENLHQQTLKVLQKITDCPAKIPSERDCADIL